MREFKMQNAKCKVQNDPTLSLSALSAVGQEEVTRECRMQNAECRMQNVRTSSFSAVSGGGASW
jgi:hypothetical protein